MNKLREPYRPDDPKNAFVDALRERFLAVLARETSIFEAVRLKLLPPYSEANSIWKSRRLQGAETWSLIAGSFHAGVAALDEESVLLQTLYSEIMRLIEEFHLLAPDGGPANWAVETILETLETMTSRGAGQVRSWTAPVTLYQEYPGLAESGWIVAGIQEDEEGALTLSVQIPPFKIPVKRMSESIKAFERRFNKACRKERTNYLTQLRREAWTRRDRPRLVATVDKLAKWQSGKDFRKINGKRSTPSTLAVFSRDLKRAAAFIGISKRESKRDPKTKKINRRTPKKENP